MQLSLPLDGLHGDIFDAVRKARGHEGLRHWATVLYLMSVKGGRTGRIVWTVNDHMDAMGYSRDATRDKTTRQRIAREVAALARLMLVVSDASGKHRIRRPLLLKIEEAVMERDSEWTVEGMTLEMHPALWDGVRKPDGSYGTNWFPASPDLPKLHHQKHPHAIILGQRIPIRLRWAMGEHRTYIDLSGRNALEFAGIQPERRWHPGRAWETFNANVTALQNLPRPGVGAVEWLRGTNTLDGVVRFHAAPWQRVMTHHRLPPIETKELPATGAALRADREARGWTQTDLARALGVSDRTVRNAEKGDALPPSIRNALARGLLPVVEIDTDRTPAATAE